MLSSTVQYYLSETKSNLNRNRHATLSTILQTLVSLFVLGILIATIINVNRIVTSFLNNLQIAVFLDDSLDTESTIALKRTIEAMDGVKEMSYTSKEKALQWAEENALFNLSGILERNPLPASFQVVTTAPEVIPGLEERIATLEGVSDIRYFKEELNHMLPSLYFIHSAGFILSFILAAATIFTISNTIRLGIYARRKEIKIMQLVGATDWTIKAPFLFEGLIYGLSGSILALFVVSLGYMLIYNLFQEDWLFRPLMVPTWQLMYNMAVLLLVLGAIIGVIGSLMSVDRYLESGYRVGGTGSRI